MDITVIDAIDTLQDRFVPRFEVFVAKAPRGAPKQVSEAILDPATATQLEIQRLDSNVFKVSGAVGAPQPSLTQLVPLAGPWGEKRGQRTDDIVSVTFTEDVSSELKLDQVVLEVLNVYDTVRKYYRYTDIPPNLDAGQTGVFPLLDYGDTIAVRFGYGSDLAWVFDGIIETLAVTFPENGESKVTVTAVDRRARLRNLKVVQRAAFNQMSDAQILANIAKDAGLRVAAPPELARAQPAAPASDQPTAGSSATPAPGAPTIAGVSSGFSLNASGGAFGQASASGQASAALTTAGASASASIEVSASVNVDNAPRRGPEPHNNFKPADQDAVSYITDRLKKASLELRCFGNTLFVLKPADVATTALRYVYRRGLSSFNPRFEGAGKATKVHLVSRDVSGNTKIEALVGADDLRKDGLIPAVQLLTVLEKIAAVNPSGDKVEEVTDYPVATPVEARRVALGILKRNADETLQADGSTIGDPRVRARTTLKIEGVGRFDGFYYVTHAEHRLDNSGYQTNFSVRRTTALTEAGSAPNGVPPKPASQLIEGLGSIVKIGIN